MGRIKGRETEVRASFGNKDLILSQMAGRSVVPAMGNTPGVEWNSETDGQLARSEKRSVETHTQNGGSNQRRC